MTATDQDWAARARAGTNGHTEDETKRQLRLTPLSDIEMEATEWLWEDQMGSWIPLGEMVALAGREGVGKSTWCACLTAKITRGELPGDMYGTPRSVVIVATEDDWKRTLKPRMVAAGVDETRVFRVDAVEADGLEDTLTLPNDVVELERIILEHSVGLVFLDPLLTLVNAKLDTHKDAEIRRALEPITRIAHNTGASFVGLVHVNKSTEGDLMNRIMGSRAIGAVIRGVLFCAKYVPVEDLGDEDGEFASPDTMGPQKGPVRVRPDQEQPGGQEHELARLSHGDRDGRP